MEEIINQYVDYLYLHLISSHFLANVYRTCTSISVPLTLKLCVLFADEWLASTTQKKLLLYVRYVDNSFFTISIHSVFFITVLHTQNFFPTHKDLCFFLYILFGSTRKLFLLEKRRLQQNLITKRIIFLLFSTQTRTRNE